MEREDVPETHSHDDRDRRGVTSGSFQLTNRTEVYYYLCGLMVTIKFYGPTGLGFNDNAFPAYLKPCKLPRFHKDVRQWTYLLN